MGQTCEVSWRAICVRIFKSCSSGLAQTADQYQDQLFIQSGRQQNEWIRSCIRNANQTATSRFTRRLFCVGRDCYVGGLQLSVYWWTSTGDDSCFRCELGRFRQHWRSVARVQTIFLQNDDERLGGIMICRVLCEPEWIEIFKEHDMKHKSQVNYADF